MKDDRLNDIVFLLQELTTDDTIPRNVKNKVKEIIDILNSADELSIKKNKAIGKADELNDDANLKGYTRSQIWDLLSRLESL